MQLHMRYLRSLEDSERVRAACLMYLQSNVIDFYPLRLDIVEQMQQTVKELGGQLEAPRLSWKYCGLSRSLAGVVPSVLDRPCPASSGRCYGSFPALRTEDLRDV
jgi:hypothetical protein